MEKGLIKENSTVVCILTGNGLKDPNNAIEYSNNEIRRTTADIKEIIKIIKL